MRAALQSGRVSAEQCVAPTVGLPPQRLLTHFFSSAPPNPLTSSHVHATTTTTTTTTTTIGAALTSVT